MPDAKTPAEKAYAAAVAEIERVREAGETRLSFDHEEFRALEEIPFEIGKLRSLMVLDFDNTKVGDLAPLAKLTALRNLSLDNTEVNDLTPLAELTTLRSLWLNETNVRDLEPLAKLTALEAISLNETEIRDLAPLANITSLKTLWLDNTKVSDLAPLTKLTALQNLWLDSTKVSDITPLAELLALRALWLDNTAVGDLAPLAELTELEGLGLNKTEVNSLAPLAELTALKSLYLEEIQVDDLRPICKLTKLDRGAEYAVERDGLHFARTPFAAATAETRRLAAIKDDQQRTRETLDFLKTLPPWPEPLPWETHSTSTAADAPPPQVQAAQTQIDTLLRQALLTQVMAVQLAEQIEAALRDVPATNGNQLPPALQSMQEVAAVLRHLAPRRDQPPDHLREPELRLRIAQLEAIIERLTGQLRNETAAREAAEALAARDGFWKSYKQSAGKAAGFASVGLFTVGVPSAAVYFLGANHPAVEAFLTVLGRLPK